MDTQKSIKPRWQIDVITVVFFLLAISQGMSRQIAIPGWAMVGDEVLMIGLSIFAALVFLFKMHPPKGWLLPFVPLISVLLSWVNAGDFGLLSLVYNYRAFFLFVPALWWGFIQYRLEDDMTTRAQQIRRILVIFGVVFLVQLPWIFYQIAGMFRQGYYDQDAVYGLFGGANVAGYFVASILFWLFPYWVEGRNRRLLGILSLAYFLLLLFEARAAILLFLAFGLLYFLYRAFWQKKNSWHVLVFMLVSSVFASLYTSTFNEDIFRLLDFKLFAQMERSVDDGANRFLWIEKTWEQLTVTHKEKFWLGFGPGNHSTYYAIKRNAPIWRSELYNAFGQLEKGHDTGVDSQLVPVMGEFGMVGLLFFYGVWVIFFLKSVPMKRIISGGVEHRDVAVAGLILFWVVNSYTNHIWEQPSLALVFYFLLGTLLKSPAKAPRKGILFFVHSFWPMLGGVESQALRQAKGLREAGYDVRVLTAQHQSGMKKYELVEGIPVYRFWYPYGLPLKPLRKLANVIAGFFAFIAINRSFPFALLHIHQLQWFTIVGFLFKQKYDYKMIGKATNIGSQSDGVKFYQTISLLAPIARLAGLREKVYRSFDRLICIGTPMLQELPLFGAVKEQLVYIPNGIMVPDLKEKKRVPTSATIQLVSMMRFMPVKNPALHIHAMSELQKLLPSVNFNYVNFGGGTLLESTRQLVHQLSLEDKVSLPGATPNPGVLAAVENADIFLNVSLSEGLSNSILEAMSYGVPLVISHVGGALDQIGQERAELTPDNAIGWAVYSNGILTEAKISPENLAHALAFMIKSQDYRKSAGQAARALIEREFAMEIVIKRYVHLYRELLGGI